jgi:hypothetical protein
MGWALAAGNSIFSTAAPMIQGPLRLRINLYMTRQIKPVGCGSRGVQGTRVPPRRLRTR